MHPKLLLDDDDENELFFCFQTFSRSFLCIKTGKNHTAELIFAFFCFLFFCFLCFAVQGGANF